MHVPHLQLVDLVHEEEGVVVYHLEDELVDVEVQVDFAYYFALVVVDADA